MRLNKNTRKKSAVSPPRMCSKRQYEVVQCYDFDTVEVYFDVILGVFDLGLLFQTLGGQEKGMSCS